MPAPSLLSFLLDNRLIEIDFSLWSQYSPTTTLLQYLRSLPEHKGTKEGCAEGDCGACTVVLAEPRKQGGLAYTAVNSCLIFLPMVHRKQVITVENLRSPAETLHPVQQSIIECYGSQCGYCTPGVVMTLFALYKQKFKPTRQELAAALAGNLCRCTGYAPLFRAVEQITEWGRQDHFDSMEDQTLSQLSSIPPNDVKFFGRGTEYFQPTSLPSALSYRYQQPTAIPINGATDFALQVIKKSECPPAILDLSAVPELSDFTAGEGGITLGAGLKLRDVAARVHPSHPALSDILKGFGSLQIRSLATLGGNIGSGSPVGDTLPVLMAYCATVLLSSVHGNREISLTEFIRGYRQTDLGPDELIRALKIPYLSSSQLVRAYKVSKRPDVDISTVSGAFRLGLGRQNRITEIIVAYGGMAEWAQRSFSTEQFLLGKDWNEENLESAGKILEKDFKPISDVRGSAEFRMVAAKNLLRKFWLDTKPKV